MLILPGHPLFDLTLATPPPDWRLKQEKTNEGINFVKDVETGIFRSVTQQELMEYLLGGEYDEAMSEEEDLGEWCYGLD